MKISPNFFWSQPGRRYATEPARRTTLLLGVDIPLALEAGMFPTPQIRGFGTSGRRL